MLAIWPVHIKAPSRFKRFLQIQDMAFTHMTTSGLQGVNRCGTFCKFHIWNKGSWNKMAGMSKCLSSKQI